MSARRVYLLSAAAVLAVPLAACGSGTDLTEGTLPALASTTTTTTAVTTTTLPVQQIYVVQSGDSLSEIAKAFQVSMTSLMTLNGITDPDNIQAGQELKIPAGEVVVTALPTTVPPPSTP
jgi:peptidoglycan endopeptidase LytE